ncbi:protein of unknown function [Sterolibacterium denitrificans]|uniref:Uncharacterized protein n=1 Tax=Sterolibacterium denitrificans TaxID=157592 RepID=A0A7Z7HPH3_9PROT|nr:protein of unknown function [Sterolibacterium denitrificans]
MSERLILELASIAPFSRVVKRCSGQRWRSAVRWPFGCETRTLSRSGLCLCALVAAGA